MVKGVTLNLSRLCTAVCMLCALFLPVSSFAQLRPEYVNALWLVQEHRLLKIATADASLLLQQKIRGDAESLAIDKIRGVVWLATENGLQAYDFSGNPIRQFSFRHQLKTMTRQNITSTKTSMTVTKTNFATRI